MWTKNSKQETGIKAGNYQSAQRKIPAGNNLNLYVSCMYHNNERYN